MSKIKIGTKTIDTSKVLIKTPRVTKTVGDFIKEIQPNFERVIMYGRTHDTNPFPTRKRLRDWLIANQNGLNKYQEDIFTYFENKCKFVSK